MSSAIHPARALFPGERPFPIIPSCEHFAGTEKLIGKAFELQGKLGPIFDITMDLEDGAPAGREKQHAEMVVDMARSAAHAHRIAGIRIHDHSHAHWPKDVDIVVRGAGEVVAYITIPKPTAVGQVAEMITAIQRACADTGIRGEIPVDERV